MHIDTITDLDPITSRSNTYEQTESTKMTMHNWMCMAEWLRLIPYE